MHRVRLASKLRRLRGLVEAHDVVFVQEAHGPRHELECLGEVFLEMVWRGTFCDSPGAGGCII